MDLKSSEVDLRERSGKGREREGWSPRGFRADVTRGIAPLTNDVPSSRGTVGRRQPPGLDGASGSSPAAPGVSVSTS